MNIFKQHGIEHLSASSLNLWTSCPGRWFATKIDKYKPPSSAAMERGSAVEAGIVSVLKGHTFKIASEYALMRYDRACRFGVLGDVPKEREHILPMMEQGIQGLKRYGTPDWPVDSDQHRVEIPIRFGDGEDETIPVVGYVDLLYPDRVIDIKSTTKCPSEMSFAHRVQAGVYARTTNRPVQFIYVTPKKTIVMEDDDVAASQRAARVIVKRLAAFLSISPDPAILRACVPVIVDGWAWRNEEDARRRLFDF